MKRFIFFLCIIAALALLAFQVFAADLYISCADTYATGATATFYGFPASLNATGVVPVSGVANLDIQSLLGPSGTYTVTCAQCTPVTGSGIPAGTQVCSSQSPPLALTLPTVAIPAAPSAAPSLLTK